MKTMGIPMTAKSSQIKGLPEGARILKFFGNLRKVFGDTVVVYSNNVKDICDELSANPKYRPKMKLYHEVQFDIKQAIFDDISNKIIRVFTPLILSKGGGLFQIILGIILVIVAVVLMVFQQWQLAIPLLMQGIGMIAAGIFQMMNTTPDNREADKREKGYSGLPKTTLAEGTRIGILFGTYLTGMHLMSYFATTSQSSV